MEQGREEQRGLDLDRIGRAFRKQPRGPTLEPARVDGKHIAGRWHDISDSFGGNILGLGTRSNTEMPGFASQRWLLEGRRGRFDVVGAL